MPPPKLPRPKGKLVAINKQTGEQIDMGPWVCIYPCYINKSLSIAKGRKVSKEIGVENPNVIEINDSVKHLNLVSTIEDKRHPKDFWMRGRVRVRLKNEDGTLANPEIKSRKVLLREVCKLVPKHVLRQKAAEQKLAQQAAASVKAAKKTQKKKTKKKNKK
mmetsp:Transcript_25844/g.55360  ORF Transcript_25844/g.55360 Transcript_25844/m.55360 type:complete len:161 (-) Transcript_25844:115-597(-)|eukprot:CAMPEP_0197496212 /NCGR_PEP_ID=MMETSP1311-20131121/42605_1 /TAXON_ID=464262 /ORGANISM="Genus nov. species nov., Strain RCC856" /LENGTH=160 /DNA_ID=CAMNT_0043041771 /DNA_START=93 /DNA_END=575 /DNA_ORIENTATION=+